MSNIQYITMNNQNIQYIMFFSLDIFTLKMIDTICVL